MPLPVGRGRDPSRTDDAHATLAERLRTLDETAWGELYDQHHAGIWRYAYVRTGSRDMADDIAAQVFAEALNSISRYRYTGKPILAWLYTIARNHLGKHFREAKRRGELRPAEPAGASLDRRLDSIVLAEALRRLTSDQREVIALRFFGGYSTREIAAAVGKRETAIYSIQVRAVAALRRHLTSVGQKTPPAPDKK